MTTVVVKKKLHTLSLALDIQNGQRMRPIILSAMACLAAQNHLIKFQHLGTNNIEHAGGKKAQGV